MQLVVGDAPANDEPVGPDDYPGSLGEDVIDETQAFAIVAFAGVILALAAALTLKPASRATFLFAELGFLGFMWIAVAGLVTDAEVTFRAGFWLGLLGLMASIAANVSAMRRRGLWACAVAGIPGMLHPIVFVLAGAVAGVIYAVVCATRRLGAPSQELLPPARVQTTGKNESSIEVSPTRL